MVFLQNFSRNIQFFETAIGNWLAPKNRFLFSRISKRVFFKNEKAYKISNKNQNFFKLLLKKEKKDVILIVD